MPNFKLPELTDKEKINYQRVLAGAISIHDFSKTTCFRKIKLAIEKNLSDENIKLNTLTSAGIASALISKKRFNGDMSDAQFFDRIQRADKILSDRHEVLDFKNQNPFSNDNVALMWGLQALASTEGYDNGAIRVRLPQDIAHHISDELEKQGHQRASTHAHGTRIEEEGIGKNVMTKNNRKFTPFGYGAIVMHRTYQDDTKNAKQFDMLFKMEDVGFKDGIGHSALHFLPPPIRKFFMTSLFHKKTDEAKNAEKEWGTFSKVSRKDHLSEIGSGVNKAIFSILDAVKKDPSLQDNFSDFKQGWKWRIAFPPWEKTIVAKDGANISVGSLLQTIDDNKENITKLPGQTENLEKLDPLLNSVLGQPRKDNSLAKCREGFEVIVDASDGPAKLIATDNKLLPKPHEEKPRKNKATQTTKEAITKQEKSSAPQAFKTSRLSTMTIKPQIMTSPTVANATTRSISPTSVSELESTAIYRQEIASVKKAEVNAEQPNSLSSGPQRLGQ